MLAEPQQDLLKDPELTGSIEGTVSRVSFYNDSTGFVIFELAQADEIETQTVKGNSGELTEGDYVRCKGELVEDKKYGEQYQATSIIPALPESTKGIEAYLSSGMISGIGEVTAKSIVKAFGTDVFKIIEEQPNKLLKVDGIGQGRLMQIKADWDKHAVEREALVFLSTYGVTAKTAMRIISVHKQATVSKVRADPYILSESVEGIGFVRADEIAMRMGISKDSEYRVRAAIKHILREAVSNGSTALHKSELVAGVVKATGVTPDQVLSTIKIELEMGKLVASEIEGVPSIYLPKLYRAEITAAKHVHRIATTPCKLTSIDFDQAMTKLDVPIDYSESQKKAIYHAIRDKIAVISGGPGSGKTTITRGVIDIVTTAGFTVTLCAPTGRASKRLSEATDRPAGTIHRTLNYNPEKRGFEYDEKNPLETDYVVVDEVSMLDINLFGSLLRAIPDHATLILVGDVDQLKSVGPGRVLHDLIISGVIPVVYLTEIHRQALESQIIVNSHRINKGECPQTSNDGDFYVINGGSPEGVRNMLLKAVSERIPAKFGFNPITETQVLSPMKKGIVGVAELNKDLQSLLNGNRHPQLSANFEKYAPGDKVIHLKNNQELDVFNGDVGIIREVDAQEKAMVIDYDGRPVEYDKKVIGQIRLAYAKTVHKSQGSEYPAVVIPLTMQHYVLLEKHLLYTGVTRGKQLVILIVEEQALKQALTTKKTGERVSDLASVIQQHY